MSSIKSNNITNQKLIQFKITLEKRLAAEKNLEWIFQKLGDIDLKIRPTNYLKLHQPYLIGNTALHLAYTYEHKSGLSIVLNQGADFTIKNQDNLTVLHLILRPKCSNEFSFSKLKGILVNTCVNMILSAHLKTRNPTNPCDGNGMSHFHIACMANHVDAVEFFLNNNVSIDHAINSDSPYFAGFTALHLAIRCCSLQVTRVLLKRGASIYLKNAEKMMTLHMVMENYLKFADDVLLGFFDHTDLPKKHSNEEVAKLLLEIVSNNDTMVIDDSGLSCLHLACTMVDSSVAEKLLKKGNINHSMNISSPLWPGYTALHFAARVNINTVEMLVKKGADLTAKDANGITPLDLCIERYKTEDIYAILSMNSVYKEITFSRRSKLLSLIFAMRDCEHFTKFLNSYSNSAHISVPIDSPLWPGFTPLHLEVLLSSFKKFYKHNKMTFSKLENRWKTRYEIDIEKHVKMMMKLHDKNANMITAQDINGRTPLHLAFRLGNMNNVVDLLLTLYDKISFPLDLVDDEDLSLLHIACSRNSKDVIEKLLSHNTNVGLTYKGKSMSNSMESGWTPLHVAVANDRVGVVNILLKYGANVLSEDANGVTPIHLLVLRGSKSAAALLSVPNLKECIIKDMGLSHLHAACHVENPDAVKKLLECGSDINLATTCDSKVADKSFELSNLVRYLGCTPLQMMMTEPSTNNFFYSDLCSCKSKTRSKIIDLLMQHGADMFVGDSNDMPFLFKHLKYFFVDLKGNTYLQMQAEAKIGLTKIHIACFSGDLDWLKNLLNDGVNVNVKLSPNLSRCAGFTPLHAVMENRDNTEIGKTEFVKLLLDRGADITISNAEQQTPLHMAHTSYANPHLADVIMMLKAQKDFSINPTDVKGISHFHIACNLSETAVVKKFLERCNLNVNQPTDFFSVASIKHCRAGFTPLHMAAISNNNYIAITSQLDTVDLLLKHGADPNFQNSYGDTALHVANRYEIFERIARDGADVNRVNANGYTPLGFLLTHTVYPECRVIVSADQIVNWLRCGCYYNSFNIFTGEGYIGLSINLIPFEELQNLIKIAAVNIPYTMRINEEGRTVIHNVVSTECKAYKSSPIYSSDERDISIIQYASLIEVLARTGCDIDCQDNLGRTALHWAAEFDNWKAISALLMVGADVNIPDKNGKTALAYGKGNFEAFADYVQKLLLCQLEVCEFNRSYVTEQFGSTIVNERFHIELEEIKHFKIQPYPLSLRSFICETDAVADYPTMPQPKKDAIDEFFHHDKISHFRNNFSEVAGLLNLQYRKAIMRTLLIEDAATSLTFLADFQVPHLCACSILQFLSNSDLRSLIASTNANYKVVDKIINLFYTKNRYWRIRNYGQNELFVCVLCPSVLLQKLNIYILLKNGNGKRASSIGQ